MNNSKDKKGVDWKAVGISFAVHAVRSTCGISLQALRSVKKATTVQGCISCTDYYTSKKVKMKIFLIVALSSFIGLLISGQYKKFIRR